MRLGLFGGTFDPPHLGHLALAAAARDQLALDRVLWIVTADPPHKDDSISPIDQRLALVAAAIAGHPHFELSRIEIDRPGPHFAADTARLLSAQRPADDLIYLMGGDSLRDLPTWGRPRELLAHCTLGVLRRPGDHVDLAALEASLPGLSQRVAFIDMPRVPISASAVRDRVAAGLPIAGLVPPLVAELIRTFGLYR
ncbi:MAG: nicotinate (nicotinamide) nucleotide adenylyltransferase [Anaerolineales bacterium]|nr:nicotinate (nicotinamide) nucleotide adenylyltransferase [Anaerolineales bacterium]